MDRINLYFDTEYDQNEMRRAILGTLENDTMKGGLPSRLAATWHHGGRGFHEVSRTDRINCPPVDPIGPMSQPL